MPKSAGNPTGTVAAETSGTGACQGGGGRGTAYSFAQLEGLWINAGGSGATAPIAAAIALAESTGCSTATFNGETPSNSVASGLWQILGVPSGFEYSQVFDPAENAAMAVAKWKGAGKKFTPWTTFTSGAYKQFMSNATPDANVPSPSTTGGGSKSSCQVQDCAWGCIPSVSLPVVGEVWHGECLITFKQARELVGALVVVGGLAILAFSFAAIIRPYAEEAGGKTAEAAGAVLSLTGSPEAGIPLAAAGHEVSKSGEKTVERREGQAATA
jgi:hypothetical protein